MKSIILRRRVLIIQKKKLKKRKENRIYLQTNNQNKIKIKFYKSKQAHGKLIIEQTKFEKERLLPLIKYVNKHSSKKDKIKEINKR